MHVLLVRVADAVIERTVISRSGAERRSRLDLGPGRRRQRKGLGASARASGRLLLGLWKRHSGGIGETASRG